MPRVVVVVLRRVVLVLLLLLLVPRVVLGELELELPASVVLVPKV